MSPIPEPQLREDVLHVEFHRILADLHAYANCPVSKAFRNKANDLMLAGGESWAVGGTTVGGRAPRFGNDQRGGFERAGQV